MFRFGPGRCCCEETISSCEDTTRSICYVDKYATGDGDGTSWEDAYTTIQSAINTHGTTHRIYIKGYGKTDPYIESPSAGGSAHLIGVSDAWIYGSLSGGSYCCYYGINVTSGNISTTGSMTQYVLCSVVDSSTNVGFSVGGNNISYNYCSVSNITGTDSCIGFGSTSSTALQSISYDNCTAGHINGGYYHTRGFQHAAGTNITFNNCLAYNLTGSGTFGVCGFYLRPSSSTSGCVLYECDAINIENTDTGGSGGVAWGFNAFWSSLENCTVTDLISVRGQGFADSTNTYTNCSCSGVLPTGSICLP